MTREEAAAILKRSIAALDDALKAVPMSEYENAVMRRHIDAYSMAVDALLEQAEVPENM